MQQRSSSLSVYREDSSQRGNFAKKMQVKPSEWEPGENSAVQWLYMENQAWEQGIPLHRMCFTAFLTAQNRMSCMGISEARFIKKVNYFFLL